MRQLRIRPRARRDLNDTIRNLIDILGAAKAQQFKARALESFTDLTLMPKMGAPRIADHQPSKDLRMWRIREFEEYLIFYSIEPDAVQIERVVHAKRDYRRHI
jgi:toxin ParE1/3/4